MIGSPGKVPQVGWPYEQMFASIAELVAHDRASAENVGKAVLEDIAGFYDVARNRPGKDEVPFALADIDVLCNKTSVNAVNRLVTALNDVRKADARDSERQLTEENRVISSIGPPVTGAVD